MNILQLTIIETQQALLDKKISGEELIRETINKIRQQDPKIGAFLSLTAASATEKGRILDLKIQKGKPFEHLEGALYSVKDCIMTNNHKCTCGSKMLEDFIAPYDGESVTAIDQAGGIPLGKTNLDEFGMGSSTEYSAFKITRNPRDLKRVAGGSSGGSAAAVAAGFGHFSLGSDTGGSIRQPAAFCGVVGLKPTYGLISRHGLVSFAPSMDQVGILAKTAVDTARVLTTLQGGLSDNNKSRSRDFTVVAAKPRDYGRELSRVAEEQKLNGDRLLEGITVGIPEEFFSMPVEKEVQQALERGIKILEKQGAVLRDVALPHFGYGLSAYQIITMAEAVSNLARFTGVAYGRRAPKAKDIKELIETSRSQGFGEEVKRRLIFGSHILTAETDALDRARQVQRLLKKDFQQAFEQADLLFAPTTGTAAFKPGEKRKNLLGMHQTDHFTTPASLTGLPAISVPCPSSGLPVGGQLIADYFNETLLLRGALAMENQKEDDPQRSEEIL